MTHDLSTPEGRLAAIESLGVGAYNALMQEHLEKSVVCVHNGKKIRTVQSRFGRLFAVEGGNAYTTLDAAKEHC